MREKIINFAEGFKTKAIGNFSHAEGTNTEAHSAGSHVEGNYNYIKNSLPTSGGSSGGGSGEITPPSTGTPSEDNWNADEHLGERSHAEGVNNISYGYASHVEGFNNKNNKYKVTKISKTRNKIGKKLEETTSVSAIKSEE